MLSDTMEQMLTKLEKVILSELLDLIRPFDLVRVAARLNSERINDPEVPKDAQPRTVTLVPLVSEFTVVVGEVWGEVVEDHGEPLDDRHVASVLINRCVAENRILS